MTKRSLILIFLLAFGVSASGAYSPNTIVTDPAGVNQAAVKAASTAAAATDPALVVAVSPNNSVSCTQSGTWTLSPGNTANTTPWLMTINEGGNAASVTASNALKVDGSAVTQPVSGTVAATQSGVWNITNISGTVSLPTGAATSANQSTANTSLSTIATNTGNIPAQGQTTMSASTPVAIASDQTPVATKAPVNGTASFSSGTATTTAATVSAPSDTVEVMIEAIDTNTANLRFEFGGTCSSTAGIQLQPGRSETLHVDKDLSICSESGSQDYAVQWVSQ